MIVPRWEIGGARQDSSAVRNLERGAGEKQLMLYEARSRSRARLRFVVFVVRKRDIAVDYRLILRQHMALKLLGNEQSWQ